MLFLGITIKLVYVNVRLLQSKDNSVLTRFAKMDSIFTENRMLTRVLMY